MRAKNWICLLLALCLLGGALPAAFAEEPAEAFELYEEPEIEAIEEAVPEASLELDDTLVQEDSWYDEAEYTAFQLRDASEAPAGEWREIDGKWYYYEGETPHKGWLLDGGKWYYLADDGAMVTGYRQIDGAWYNFNGSGAMDENKWRFIDGEWYWFTASGARAKNWRFIDNKWYWFDAEGRMVTGWQAIGNATYYMTPSGAMAEGWRFIDEEWYYFTPGSGAMAAGRWRWIGNKWYYFEDNGIMAVGWTMVGSKYYFMGDSGAMTEGWRWIDGSWYYFIPGNGAQAFGWRQIDGKWYYFNTDENDGSMMTGWMEIGGRTYYFASSGAMVTGSQVIDGVSYTFSGSGALISGQVAAVEVLPLLNLNVGDLQARLRAMGLTPKHYSNADESWYQAWNDQLYVDFESDGSQCFVGIELASGSARYSLAGIRCGGNLAQARNLLGGDGWIYLETEHFEDNDQQVTAYEYTRVSGAWTFDFELCTVDGSTVYTVSCNRYYGE